VRSVNEHIKAIFHPWGLRIGYMMTKGPPGGDLARRE
jgi:hypothetical protein